MVADSKAAIKLSKRWYFKRKHYSKLVDDIYAEGYVGKDKKDFDSVLYMNL